MTCNSQNLPMLNEMRPTSVDIFKVCHFHSNQQRQSRCCAETTDQQMCWPYHCQPETFPVCALHIG